MVWMSKKKSRGQVSILTSSRAVGDGKHLSSKLISLYLFDKLSSFSYEALDTSVLSVSNTNLLLIREEHQTVGDLKRCAPSPV